MYVQPISRRSFLRKSAITCLSAPLLSNIQLEDSNKGPRRKWGIILNTVKNEMEVDYQSTLLKLAEMGYRYLEGRYYGKYASSYAQYIQSLGLQAVAGGSSIGRLKDNLDEYLQTAEMLAQEYITCYWPWTGSADHLTYAQCMETAEALNDLGKRIKEASFTFTWHNHDKEFQQVQKTTPFDLLMENTDPQWVKVQMDIYWVVKGNHNPVDLFRKYPGRFDLVHLKDMNDTPERAICCVGEGIIDFQAIFDQTELAGIKYAIVEHEINTKGIACAQVSIDHFERIN